MCRLCSGIRDTADSPGASGQRDERWVGRAGGGGVDRHGPAAARRGRAGRVAGRARGGARGPRGRGSAARRRGGVDRRAAGGRGGRRARPGGRARRRGPAADRARRSVAASASKGSTRRCSASGWSSRRRAGCGRRRSSCRRCSTTPRSIPSCTRPWRRPPARSPCWLAERNPRWAFVRGAGEDVDAVWADGGTDERRALLERVRRTDPARAREVLEATFADETWEDRVAFLDTLAVGLSDADEPLLERALDDRRKPVRDAAAHLLTRPAALALRRPDGRARGAADPRRGRAPRRRPPRRPRRRRQARRRPRRRPPLRAPPRARARRRRRLARLGPPSRAARLAGRAPTPAAPAPPAARLGRERRAGAQRRRTRVGAGPVGGPARARAARRPAARGGGAARGGRPSGRTSPRRPCPRRGARRSPAR